MSNLRPLKAVRKYCLGCMLDQPKEVKLCPTSTCPLHEFRFGKGKLKLKHIYENCLDCSGYEIEEVKNCQFFDCSLYEYRMGKNPNRSSKDIIPEGNGSSEK